jgi:hypothetical protein
MSGMNTSHLPEDFGDEPAIEERMCPYYTEEGLAMLEEFHLDGAGPVIAPVVDVGFQAFLHSFAKL